MDAMPLGHKRWFVLPPASSTLSYYKSEADQIEGKPALGTVECSGATIFLKEVKNGVYRFTIESASRGLKLRAATAADYDAWTGVLQPFASSVRERTDTDASVLDVTDGVGGLTTHDPLSDFDADDDADEAPGNPFGGPPADPRAGAGASTSASNPFGSPAASAGNGGASEANIRANPSSSGGAPMPTGMRGVLGKKSGGKADKSKWKLTEKWNKRWFVLAPGSSQLSYYKNETEHVNGKEALGGIDCAGATVFLKEVKKGGAHRFTIRTSIRELKLRADDEVTYQSWIAALRPFAASFTNMDDSLESSRSRQDTFQGDEGDEDDSD